MKLELFRPQARRVARQRLEGAVVLATPPSSLTITLIVGVLVACLVLGAAFVPIYRSENAVGWIVPTTGFARLSAPRGGFVSHIAVAEGDRVSAGEILVVVRASSEAEGQDSAGRLEESMTTQARADAQTARASIARLSLEHQQIERRVQMLNAQLAESATRLDLQRQRLEIANAELLDLLEGDDIGAQRDRVLTKTGVISLSARCAPFPIPFGQMLQVPARDLQRVAPARRRPTSAARQ